MTANVAKYVLLLSFFLVSLIYKYEIVQRGARLRGLCVQGRRVKQYVFYYMPQ